MMRSTGLYARAKFGSKMIRLGPLNTEQLALAIAKIVMRDDVKDGTRLELAIESNPIHDTPADHAQAEHDAIVKRKLQESEDAGRNARPGEDWHSYVERTIRDEVWPNSAYAMNTADFLFGPSPEARRFREDSLAQMYIQSQTTRETWNRLTPDEKRQLCRHMETTWEGTRFWIGEHRFTD